MITCAGLTYSTELRPIGLTCNLTAPDCITDVIPAVISPHIGDSRGSLTSSPLRTRMFFLTNLSAHALMSS